MLNLGIILVIIGIYLVYRSLQDILKKTTEGEGLVLTKGNNAFDEDPLWMQFLFSDDSIAFTKIKDFLDINKYVSGRGVVYNKYTTSAVRYENTKLDIVNNNKIFNFLNNYLSENRVRFLGVGVILATSVSPLLTNIGLMFGAAFHINVLIVSLVSLLRVTSDKKVDYDNLKSFLMFDISHFIVRVSFYFYLADLYGTNIRIFFVVLAFIVLYLNSKITEHEIY